MERVKPEPPQVFDQSGKELEHNKVHRLFLGTETFYCRVLTQRVVSCNDIFLFPRLAFALFQHDWSVNEQMQLNLFPTHAVIGGRFLVDTVKFVAL